MSEANAHPPQGAAPHAAAHPHINYVKVWAVLCVLLVVSVTGPFIGIQVVTMITAFGIAIVKAYLVATKFMHINLEKKFVVYILLTMLALMLIFFGGVSPDVMKHNGRNWDNTAAQHAVEVGMAEKPEHEGAEHH